MQCLTLIGYIISLMLQLAMLVFGVYYIVKCPHKITDIQEKIVLSTIFLLYLFNALEELVHNWNNSPWFYDVLPFGNMSPFVFTLCFICMFLPKNIKKYLYSVISILMIGMAGAGLANGVSVIFKY